MSGWAATAARAAGLSSRRLPPATMAELRAADELGPLRRAVAARGFPLGVPADAAAIEQAVRLGAGAELRALDRWLDTRQRVALAPLFAAEDRRTLRRILRGIAAGRSPAVRGAGALPTPTLPAPAIAELARQPTVPAVLALLALWGSPFAAELADATTAGEPRLLALELALDRTVAAIGRRALRPGGRPLRRLVPSLVDGGNAAAAIVLAGGERELTAEECFVAGGARLPRIAFLAAAAASDAVTAARRLAPRFAGALGAALRRGETRRGRLEGALHADLLREQRQLALELPLSAAPVCAWVLALQGEAAALRRAAWRVTLGLPESAAESAPEEAA
jgi:vacuolar-type H+-ATPase subunit C/Vma6